MRTSEILTTTKRKASKVPEIIAKRFGIEFVIVTMWRRWWWRWQWRCQVDIRCSHWRSQRCRGRWHIDMRSLRRCRWRRQWWWNCSRVRTDWLRRTERRWICRWCGRCWSMLHRLWWCAARCCCCQCCRCVCWRLCNRIWLWTRRSCSLFCYNY